MTSVKLNNFTLVLLLIGSLMIAMRAPIGEEFA